jgi:lauroyl/myristoyl acyltransferase
MAMLSRMTRRRLKRLLGWERLKEAGVYVMAWLIDRRDELDDHFFHSTIKLGGALIRSFYYFPANPWRSACRDISVLGGAGRTPRQIYFGLVDRIEAVARLFLVVLKKGADSAALSMGFDEESEERIRNAHSRWGGGFLLLPHCVGGVLSAAYFAKVVPTVIISKGPPSPKRAEIQRTFIELLGVELLVIDTMAKSTVARSILRTIRSKNFIVATTDLMKKTDESIEETFFGRPVHLPSWPARFSQKTGCPIIPGYVCVKGDRLVITAGEPFFEKDIARATSRWARAFEDFILGEPSDWAFLFDLRWGKILKQAVRST